MDGPKVSIRFHRKPRFSSALKNYKYRQSTNSIIYHPQYPKQRKRKMSQYFSNNTNSVNTAINVSNNYTIADSRSQILTWLSLLDPKLRHQNVQQRRVGNVGEWLLQTQEFKSWCAGSGEGEFDNAVLFCYGGPGVGKTYIRYKE